MLKPEVTAGTPAYYNPEIFETSTGTETPPPFPSIDLEPLTVPRREIALDILDDQVWPVRQTVSAARWIGAHKNRIGIALAIASIVPVQNIPEGRDIHTALNKPTASMDYDMNFTDCTIPPTQDGPERQPNKPTGNSHAKNKKVESAWNIPAAHADIKAASEAEAIVSATSNSTGIRYELAEIGGGSLKSHLFSQDTMEKIESVIFNYDMKANVAPEDVDSRAQRILSCMREDLAIHKSRAGETRKIALYNKPAMMANLDTSPDLCGKNIDGQAAVTLPETNLRVLWHKLDHQEGVMILSSGCKNTISMRSIVHELLHWYIEPYEKEFNVNAQHNMARRLDGLIVNSKEFKEAFGDTPFASLDTSSTATRDTTREN